MPDIESLKKAIETKARIQRRHLNRLIAAKEAETLLPRDQAILALAVERGVPVSRYASAEDLAALRGIAPSATGASAATTASPAVPAKQSKKSPTPKKPTRGRKVFVVYGRNDALRRDLFTFLRAIGLQPLEWTKGIAATKVASPSVKQIIDAMFSEAVAVVVLLTPDDLSKLREDFQKPSDPPYEKELTGQARPNVLFEAGMAFGNHPDSTVLVQIGKVKPFTDVGGLHITHLSNEAASRSELVTKLQNAGCNVDVTGTDWYSAGDFDIANTE